MVCIRDVRAFNFYMKSYPYVKLLIVFDPYSFISSSLLINCLFFRFIVFRRFYKLIRKDLRRSFYIFFCVGRNRFFFKHENTSCNDVCLVNGKKSCREEKGTNRFKNDREEAVVAANNTEWLHS